LFRFHSVSASRQRVRRGLCEGDRSMSQIEKFVEQLQFLSLLSI
jgi:hypothetical protein